MGLVGALCRRRKDRAATSASASALQERLLAEEKEGGRDLQPAASKPGYVPMVVGKGEAGEKRFLVHTGFLKDPAARALLEMAAQEFGYGQRGALRIPCAVDHFHRVLRDANKGRNRASSITRWRACLARVLHLLI